MGRQRASTSFSLFLSVAFACIVGSEHGRVSSRPRASNGGYHDLIKRFFGGLYGKPAKPLLTDDQIDSYVRDGFVVVSGLLDADEIERLLGAGESIVSKHAEKLGGQLPPKNFQVHEFALALNDDRFRDIALHSKLPRAAAELMQLDSESQNLRVLRDVFLAKGPESTSSCGWHIDDQVFWPAEYQMPHASKKVDQSSINAWIALDDMPIENGGSMAVSPASHAEAFTWREDAYAALNFNDKFGNGVSKEDLFEIIKSGKIDTCALETFAPQVYYDIELTKQEFDFKRGDVIFMNRWLFHRSNDLTEKGRLALQALRDSYSDDPGAALLKRYSLRYATGTTSLPGGFTTELSVLASDGLNLGKQLDQVSGEWYPQVWPSVHAGVEEKIEELVRTELPVAQERLGAVMAEVMGQFKSR